jgi:hypothetical protein
VEGASKYLICFTDLHRVNIANACCCKKNQYLVNKGQVKKSGNEEGELTVVRG